MNIYDAFRAVWVTGWRICGSNPEKAASFMLEKLEQITKSWQSSLCAAQNHGQWEKAHIEKIKLDTADQIRQEVLRVREVTHDRGGSDPVV